jgi:hypothetical protein
MEPAILSENWTARRDGPDFAVTPGMKKTKPGGAPGASTAEEVEHSDRQPGGKGRAADPPAAPQSSPRQETGTGGPPPANNSAPGPKR